MVDRAWEFQSLRMNLVVKNRKDWQAQRVPSCRWGRVGQGVGSGEWLERRPQSALYVPGSMLGTSFPAGGLCGQGLGLSWNFKSD